MYTTCIQLYGFKYQMIKVPGKILNGSVCSMDEILTGFVTPGQRKRSNEEVLQIPQISKAAPNHQI